MKRDHQKMTDEIPGSDMDELLAVLGYKVKSSEMADVAQKLEQLEMAMGTSQPDGTATISQLSDTVHYNPSDISGWLETMLSGLNPCSINNPPLSSCSYPTYLLPQQDSELMSDLHSDSEYDLAAIPGSSLYPPSHPVVNPSTSSNKRIKHEPISPQPITITIPTQTSSLVPINPAEAGVRLVHTLQACAESIQSSPPNNLRIASTLLKQIGLLAVSQSGSMRKVATYFAEALARRIYNIQPPNPNPSSSDLVLQSHFYEACPYLKFAHFTANQAILEAFTGARRVHVIDFSLKQGMQWPALIQALAIRPDGPPVFRLTGVGPNDDDDANGSEEVGRKLAQFAETLGVEFYYRGVVCDDLSQLELDLMNEEGQEEEVVAVNSVFELHRVLARPGGIEKLLRNIRSVMKPRIFTVVEQEANHNESVFLERFNEALHYYSTMFDSLEGVSEVSEEDVGMSQMYLGSQICNVVGCEGAERVERHETLVQWRGRLEAAGFETVHLGSNAFKQARMLLALSGGGDGYKVEENDGCLLLGWHTRPLIAASAWRLAPGW